METEGVPHITVSPSSRGFQFLAVITTDVTKLPKATTRAPSMNFQDIP